MLTLRMHCDLDLRFPASLERAFKVAQKLQRVFQAFQVTGKEAAPFGDMLRIVPTGREPFNECRGKWASTRTASSIVPDRMVVLPRRIFTRSGAFAWPKGQGKKSCQESRTQVSEPGRQLNAVKKKKKQKAGKKMKTRKSTR